MVKRFFVYGLTASAAISLIYLLIIKMVAGAPAFAPMFFYLWALTALPVLINGLLLSRDQLFNQGLVLICLAVALAGFLLGRPAKAGLATELRRFITVYGLPLLASGYLQWQFFALLTRQRAGRRPEL